MTYVIDASVAIKWFVPENLHDRALALLDRPERLQAPDIIVAETASIAWKKSLRGEIVPFQAQAITTAVRRSIPQLYPSLELVERALEVALRLRHPIYDCLYIVCAEIAAGILITADRGLYATVHGTEYEALVRDLETFVP